MPEVTKQNYRMKLGPSATALLDHVADPTAATLDAEIDRLVRSEQRTDILVKERDDAVAGMISMSGSLSAVTKALAESSKASDAVHHLLDHRTKSMTTLLLHISGLIGTHFTQGEDRTRLHERLETLQTEMQEQMDVLATLVGKRQIERQSTVQRAVARAEEERMAVAAKEEQAIETRMQRGGQER